MRLGIAREARWYNRTRNSGNRADPDKSKRENGAIYPRCRLIPQRRQSVCDNDSSDLVSLKDLKAENVMDPSQDMQTRHRDNFKISRWYLLNIVGIQMDSPEENTRGAIEQGPKDQNITAQPITRRQQIRPVSHSNQIRSLRAVNSDWMQQVPDYQELTKNQTTPLVTKWENICDLHRKTCFQARKTSI